MRRKLLFNSLLIMSLLVSCCPTPTFQSSVTELPGDACKGQIHIGGLSVHGDNSWLTARIGSRVTVVRSIDGAIQQPSIVQGSMRVTGPDDLGFICVTGAATGDECLAQAITKGWCVED